MVVSNVGWVGMLPTFSVTSFLSQVNDIIFGEYIIEGEVSQYKVSQGKWVFFDLKDENSVLGCFSTVFMMRQPLADGMKVRVLGYPKVYEKTGKFSFTVQKVELVGEGSLKKAFSLLKQKLEKEGLFNPERKRALPEIPERLGVIASRDSAAWGDFRRILANRFGGVELVLQHVNVQGVEAVADVVRAFEKFTAYKDRLDAIVLIRGGGSLEDLAAFNDEAVVRAIYSSRVPVVTGIGHERDETLADYVADLRASTPSNAAELLVPDRESLRSHIVRDREFMANQLEHEIALHRQRVQQSAQALSAALQTLFILVEQVIERFGQTKEKLKMMCEAYKKTVHQSGILLVNVDPKRLLRRGYSVVRDARGNIITSITQAAVGKSVSIELADGHVKTRVESSHTS